MKTRGEGWVAFAAFALITAGVMRLFDSIWAFNYHGVLPENLEDAIFSGSQLARWVGVTAGAIAAISAIWWMPYYPVWSLMYIGIGGAVIYALVAHGGREPA
jgi:hypothetical protein